MDFKQFETGRSMVEMLGTLAIIGVLSIGGIAGYSYGMDKYRANQTANDINLRAVDLIAQVGRGGDLSLSEWSTKTASEYDIGLEMEAGEATGGIFVSSVPNRVCEMLSEMLIQTATIKIGATEYTESTNIACGEENNMVFYHDDVFNTDENACQDMENGVCFDSRLENLTPCTTVDDCPNTQCWWCVNGRCFAQPSLSTCPLDGNRYGTYDGFCNSAGECVPERNVCTSHSDCEDDEFCDKSSLSGVDIVDQTKEGDCVKFYVHKETLTLNDGTSKTIYVSDRRVPDISVVDLCDRIGKRMLTYEDLYVGGECPDPNATGTPTALREALINRGYDEVVINRRIWDSDLCQEAREAGGFLWRTDLVSNYYAPGEAMEGAICH